MGGFERGSCDWSCTAMRSAFKRPRTQITGLEGPHTIRLMVFGIWALKPYHLGPWLGHLGIAGTSLIVGRRRFSVCVHGLLHSLVKHAQLCLQFTLDVIPLSTILWLRFLCTSHVSGSGISTRRVHHKAGLSRAWAWGRNPTHDFLHGKP